jgi:ABC-2 type transport system ATP-binding protein
MINVKGLTKSYGGVTVLDLPQLNIPKGESFGLVGNNGAGKTTFFRLILDLIKPDSGMVMIKDENVAGNDNWKKYTGSYLDKNFLIDFLTPEEYFDFLRSIYRMTRGDVDNFLASFEEFFNGEILGKSKYIRDLSSGNQQKLGVAAALMPRPELIILDEPFNSLDPTTQIRLKRILNEIREKRQVTMLISSHDLNHITEVCDRICVLEEGKIVQDIPASSGTLKALEEYFSA